MTAARQLLERAAILAAVKSGGESAMIFSALLCSLPIALSQATSSAVKGGIVVVVGGGVVLVLAVLGVDSAVELAVLPPHPVASTVTVRQAARRAGGWHVGGCA